MAAASVIGDLVVRISGDASDLSRASNEATRSVEGLASSVASTVRDIAKLGVATAVAGAAMAAGLVYNSMLAIDANSKLSREVDGTVAGLQTLQYAATSVGMSTETMNGSILALNGALGEAANKAGPAHEALRRLGLSAADLTKLDADKRLLKIAERLDELNLPASTASKVLSALGLSARGMFTLLEDAGESIRTARTELEGFGALVSQVDARQIENAGLQWNRVKAALEGIANQIAVQLIPFLSLLNTSLGTATDTSVDFGAKFVSALSPVITVIAFLNKEIYQFKIDLDDMMKDLVDFTNTAGSMASKLRNFFSFSGDAVSFEPIRNEYGKLRETLEKPASYEEWMKWFQTMREDGRRTAEEQVKNDEARKNSALNTGKLMTEQEMKKFQAKLLALQEQIATEDEALRVQAERQLLMLSELEKNKIITSTEAAAMREQLETKHRDKMNELIWNKIRSGAATEQQILQHNYEKRLKDLQNFEANQTITVEEANAVRKRLAEEHQMAVLQIAARGYSGLADIAGSALSSISAIMGDESGKQFTVMKALSMAVALVKGFEAAVSAYAAGVKIGGPPVGTAFAAVAAVSTAAIIAKIAGVNFKGRRFGGSVNAGEPYWVGESGKRELFVPNRSGNIVPQHMVGSHNTGGGDRTLLIEGINPDQFYSGTQIRTLIKRINEETRDGSTVRVR